MITHILACCSRYSGLSSATSTHVGSFEEAIRHGESLNVSPVPIKGTHGNQIARAVPKGLDGRFHVGKLLEEEVPVFAVGADRTFIWSRTPSLREGVVRITRRSLVSIVSPR